MAPDKRKRSRVHAGLDAVLSCGGLEKFPVRVKNLSLKGMLCDQDSRIGDLKECVVTFELSEAIVFRIESRMIRNDDKGLALDFESMDEKAFFHLRNLVRYNSEDPDTIDQELAVPAFSPKKNG
jgi:hypothetical protein